MAETFTIPSYFMVIVLFMRRFIGGKSKPWINLLPQGFLALDVANKLYDDDVSIKTASKDYGNIVHRTPKAVFHPSTVQDIANLIQLACNSSVPFGIATRGHGHSVRGQSMAQNGVVIDMMKLRSVAKSSITVAKSKSAGFFYADVGGEHLWIDVLHATLEHGFSPVSWTDYLYLTVGGTLSNAGISGQSFRYGPQISNVYEMDVVTGKGEVVTCSAHKNSELFFAVLGGLGQFGVITRARIALEPAPKRVKWVRMLYDNLSAFTEDQERLISINGRKESKALDYLEGSIMVDQGSPNNWRSSFFTSSDTHRIMSLLTKHRIIYCLEVAKYYDDSSKHTVDMDLQELSQGLNFIEGFKYQKDVKYVEFLDRVRSGELKLQAQGLWDVPHPWLNLFLPKSQIAKFDSGVFRDIILRRNITSGPVLIYPMNRNKWDERMSAVIPEGEVFYTIGFLHSSGFSNWQEFDEQNKEILQFCDENGIDIKQYLPHYPTREQWRNHFGSKWTTFKERKEQFDPKMILSPGQRIFNQR